MGEPRPGDPFGEKPDPTSFDDMIGSVVDARIEMRLRGRIDSRFDGVPDIHLVHELIARGWAVFKPKVND